MLSYTLMGNGLAFWNTMPARFRSRVTSVRGVVNVLSIDFDGAGYFAAVDQVVHPVQGFDAGGFPQPDGPIKAVTWFSGISRFRFFQGMKISIIQIHILNAYFAVFHVIALPFFKVLLTSPAKRFKGTQ